MDADEYCRELEAHLCRRNEGHLVRIVGPAFEKACDWARMGIPLRIACHGIDRHVDRAAAKGPRRRPVRLEFCEADILDAFDTWRRAVGVRGEPGAGGDPGAEAGAGVRPKRSLPAHLDRAVARLTAVRAGAVLSPEWDAALDRAIGEIDGLRPGAEKARGAVREGVIAALGAVDARLLAAARATAAPMLLAEVDRDADADLEPFRLRLAEPAFARARRAARDRVLRDRLGLPVIEFE